MPDPIVTKGAKILKTILREVPKTLFGTKEIEGITRRMSESLRATEFGVAIAANQIGVNYRIFVVRGFILAGKERSAEGSNDIRDEAFINPTIVRSSKKKELMDEACLSVPGFHGSIIRSTKTTVRAFDLAGKKFERGGSGLLAEIFQHEYDHLNGILYIEKAETVTPNPKEEPDAVLASRRIHESKHQK